MSKPLFVLVQHWGDYIGYYTHSVVAASKSRKKLEKKIEELKKRPNEMAWKYEIDEGVEVL